MKNGRIPSAGSSSGDLHQNDGRGSGQNDDPRPVAVDAMGGDHGLIVQVEGAIEAYKEFGARSILVGPESDLRAAVDSFGAGSLPLEIRHAPDVIEMDDSPGRAVRRKPQSSLCVAYKLVHDGEASAILSSGNSGAMMAAGRVICGLLPGIERPAIATLIPSVGEALPNVVIDSGANVECHAQNLVQFAVMGSIYYSSLFDEKRPTVALLSNGTEASKGTDIIRGASAILAHMESLNYVGYVEGRDVTSGKAQVIVCDGFVGNVLLKAMEGCVGLIFKQLMHEGKKTLFRKFALFMSRGLYREVFRQKFDYTAYGGAPLLGLTNLAIVLHGSSQARAVKNAVRLADSFAKSRMTEKITQALTQLEEHLPDMEGEVLSAVFSKNSELSGMRNSADRDPGERVRAAKGGAEESIDEVEAEDRGSHEA